MKFCAKLDQDDVTDLRRMIRSRMYCSKLLVANWYVIVLLCTLFCVTFEALSGAIRPNWGGIGLMWLVILAIVPIAFYRTKRARAKELSQLQAMLPEWISLGDDGVKVIGLNGASSSVPWINFKTLREGQRVMLLDMHAGGFVMLPVAGLPEQQRESIRQLFRSHAERATVCVH